MGLRFVEIEAAQQVGRAPKGPGCLGATFCGLTKVCAETSGRTTKSAACAALLLVLMSGDSLAMQDELAPRCLLCNGCGGSNRWATCLACSCCSVAAVLGLHCGSHWCLREWEFPVERFSWQLVFMLDAGSQNNWSSRPGVRTSLHVELSVLRTGTLPIFSISGAPCRQAQTHASILTCCMLL